MWAVTPLKSSYDFLKLKSGTFISTFVWAIIQLWKTNNSCKTVNKFNIIDLKKNTTCLAYLAYIGLNGILTASQVPNFFFKLHPLFLFHKCCSFSSVFVLRTHSPQNAPSVSVSQILFLTSIIHWALLLVVLRVKTKVNPFLPGKLNAVSKC